MEMYNHELEIQKIWDNRIKIGLKNEGECKSCGNEEFFLAYNTIHISMYCQKCKKFKKHIKQEKYGIKPDSTKWTKEERLLNAEYQGEQMNEHQLQALCFTWHWNNRPDERGLLYMNHNNPRDARHGASLKVMGLVAGVADMTYIHPDRSGVTFLEFKAEKGRQSASQMWWQSTVERSGCNYKIIKTFEEFTKSLAF